MDQIENKMYFRLLVTLDILVECHIRICNNKYYFLKILNFTQ